MFAYLLVPFPFHPAADWAVITRQPRHAASAKHVGGNPASFRRPILAALAICDAAHTRAAKCCRPPSADEIEEAEPAHLHVGLLRGLERRLLQLEAADGLGVVEVLDLRQRRLQQTLTVFVDEPLAFDGVEPGADARPHFQQAAERLVEILER